MSWKEIMWSAAAMVTILIIATSISNGYKSDVKQWIELRGEKLKDIEYRSVSLGPYWYMKHLQVYRAETATNVYWFRFGHLFGSPDVYIEKDGDYKELDYNK